MLTPTSTPSRVAHSYFQDDPSFLMVPYMRHFRDCLDAWQFVAIRLSRDVQTVRHEQHGRERDTALAAWTILQRNNFFFVPSSVVQISLLDL